MPQKVLLTFYLLFSSTLFAKDSGNFFQTEVEMGLERSHLGGHLRVGTDSNNTQLDLHNDMGLSQATAGLKAMLTRTTKHHRFGFKLEKYEHSGSKKLSDNIIHNGSTYATASLINSKVSLKWAKAKYRYRYTENLSIGVTVNAMRLKTMINEEETKETLILPAIGADYEREIDHRLNLIIKASSTITGDSNYHYGYAGLSYDLKVLNCTSFHLGYQYKNLRIKSDEIDADLKYQGLYAGLAMQF